MNDSTQAAFDALEKLLKHNLEQDLNNNRKDIEEIIATEILSRYYYQKGRIIETLKHDPAMDTVRTLIADPERYKAILRPQKK